MKRVCLIVDHPLRDLEGMVLVGSHLAMRGAEVFIVPMYQKHEIWSLRPDFVLLNYLRTAHQRLLETCLNVGIAVGVLDTEGGIRNDFEILARQVEPMLPGVALYCVWGGVQRNVLAEVTGRHGVRLVETGCPRYDFAARRWAAALRLPATGSGPIVLVNMNFPVANSRFQSEEQEIRNIVDVGWSEDVARARVMQTRIALNEMIRTVSELAERLPDARIVCRPHPFENADRYRQAFAALSNVQVHQEGAVMEWIAQACVLVHHNCSTAIEAAMMSVEPIVIDWLDTPLLAQPPTVAVSHRAASFEALVGGVRSALSDRPPRPTPEMVAARESIVADYFHSTDGRSSERVADAILETMPSTVDRESDARYAFRVCLSGGGGVPGQAHRFATLTLGNGVSRAVRDLVRPSRADLSKRFGPSDVEAVVGRLRRADPSFANVSVSAMGREHAISGLTGGGLSVRIAAA